MKDSNKTTVKIDVRKQCFIFETEDIVRYLNAEQILQLESFREKIHQGINSDGRKIPNRVSFNKSNPMVNKVIKLIVNNMINISPYDDFTYEELLYIGRKIYKIENKRLADSKLITKIVPYIVKNHINNAGITITYIVDINGKESVVYSHDYNKKVFLTKEDAEKKLSQIKPVRAY